MSNGGKWGNIRLSLTNSNQKGMIPNTEQIKRTFNFSGQTNITDKLSFDAKGSYININGNLNGAGYTFNNVGMQTVWTGRQVDWEYRRPILRIRMARRSAGSTDGMRTLTGWQKIS